MAEEEVDEEEENGFPAGEYPDEEEDEEVV